MPNTCSAPGCRSNYSGQPYTPVFKLSSNPQDVRVKWLRALHREDIEDLKNLFVCSKHFADKDLITEVDMLQHPTSMVQYRRFLVDPF